MKKRILSLLLAVSIACSLLVVPANAAASNAAVQTAVTLGGLTSEPASALSTALPRGELAKLLVAFSADRERAAARGVARQRRDAGRGRYRRPQAAGL